MSTADHRGWLLVPLVAWVVGFAAAASLVVPAVLERDQLRGEVETLWIEHAHALESTVNADALAQQTEFMKSEHEDLAVRLPDAVDAGALRDQIRSEATVAGLQVESLEIAPRQVHEFYGHHAVRLVAIGHAQAAHAMLTTVLYAPPVRRINAFSLQRMKYESAALLRLELELHAYEYRAP